LEWIEKAEGDWDVAQRAYRARKRPSYDAACFHIQQCLEKYLKAWLNEVGIIFAKTHDLSDLLDDILPTEPSWVTLQPVLKALTKYAVLYRYPGYNASKSETLTALKDCRKVRRIIRAAFGLPV
ncbi:MAG: HEPN domain-containing protein, partial [Blastocatellia bacterium]